MPIGLLSFGAEQSLAIEQTSISIKKVKSFEQWCRQKKSLSAATRLNVLYLSNNQISDIQSLTGFDNLYYGLWLDGNNIKNKQCSLKFNAYCRFEK